jgi:aspartate 4-decarboxylase
MSSKPAWVVVTPREAFFTLGRFATEESRRSGLSAHLTRPIVPDGLAERLSAFAGREPDLPGLPFLADAVAYGIDVLGFDPDSWVYELARGALGDARPRPARILGYCEQVVRAFFTQRLCGGSAPPGRFDVFATDDGRGVLGRVVETLLANRLLVRGDRVAVGSSVLMPNVEIPNPAALGLDVVHLYADPADDWQFPQAEIDKLTDPAVKALFLVNPPGPELLALRDRTVEQLEAIVRGPRPDLLVVSDEAFGTFVPGFRSLAAVLPASVLALYSFDRHLGCAGWRLGVAVLHQDNAYDCMLAELPDRVREETGRRYMGSDGNGQRLRFIDRMVVESSSVALRFGAGLSPPQQTQASLFALFFLTGAADGFVEATTALLTGRRAELYRGLGRPVPVRPASAVPYFALFDVLEDARDRYGDDFAGWLRRARDPRDLVRALGVGAASVLPDGGINPDGWTVRLSLADASAEDCAAIGAGIAAAVDEAHLGYLRGRRRRGRRGLISRG